MHVASAILVVTVVATCVSGYPHVWNGNHYTPVHGLYVKRSTDGTTGDLFVAATEDSGVKSQWAVDQPINFLPVSSASAQPHVTAIPVSYPAGYPTVHDEGTNQKRAVMPSPNLSAPVQYAYAMPMPTGSTPTENTPVVSYPYAYTVPSSPSESSTTKCEHQASVPNYPYQFPYQLFYPQMMSAYTNAMSILKDAGLNEESASSVMSQASPTWPPASYAYPMYVMVDPNSWNQNQATTSSPTTTSPSSPPVSQPEESTPA